MPATVFPQKDVSGKAESENTLAAKGKLFHRLQQNLPQSIRESLGAFSGTLRNVLSGASLRHHVMFQHAGHSEKGDPHKFRTHSN